MIRTAKLIKIAVGLAGASTLAACATLEETAAELTAETYNATLTGNGVAGSGDTDGYATAEVTITDELNGICYDVNDIRNLGTITGAHIHRGAAGTNGPVVLSFKQANEGGFKNCVSRSEWKEDIIENNPQMFYVQIHTSEYPNGAIRGQLRSD